MFMVNSCADLQLYPERYVVMLKQDDEANIVHKKT